MEQSRVPDPQIVYGKVIFRLCIFAALICVVAPLMAITFPEGNFMDPRRLFSTIWEGNDAESVWYQVGGGFPGGHFWLRNLRTSGSPNQRKLQFQGWSAGSEWKRLSDFHKDLKHTKEFFDDFNRIDAPEGKRKQFADGRVPAEAVAFSFKMDLKPRTKGKKK